MKLKSASGFAGVCAEAGLTNKWLAPALLLVLLATVSFGVGNPRPAYAHDLCPNTGSPLGPFDMETYEDHRQTYGRTFELAGNNQLLPELAGFALPGMETGPRSAGSSQLRPGYVPPVLLKAIAWIEASWAQADYSVPYGAAGPTLISHDCGYGLMQVTTGMQNVTGIPSVNQAMIGGHYAFNIARGAQIVVDKWNTAPEYRPVVGSRDPTILENWYYAVWGYNGFSYKNHPLNPIYPANRLPYSCGPTNDGFGHNRGQYPYQELVFGCMAHPPIVAGVPLWTPQPVYLAQPSHPAFAGPLSNANWDACAYNLQCAPMDMPTPIPNNRDSTPLTVTRSQVIGTPVLSLTTQNIQMVAVPPSQPGTASLTITNAGTGILSYRITSNVPWLRASRLQGVALGANLGGKTSTLQVSADMLGLGAGQHTGTLTIESPLTANAPANVTVVVDTYPQGTLLKGSGPEVYLMWGGLRRHVPNEFTFAVNAYDLSRVIVIPNGVLASIPLGNPLLNALADGNLYRGSGPAVWVMGGGAKRHVTTESAFYTCGYGWSTVRQIPEALLNTVVDGAELSGAPCPLMIPPTGSLVRGTGPKIYVVKSGLKRHVPNGQTFDAHKLRWGNVDTIADSQTAMIPGGNQVLDALTAGSLIRGPGAEVYVMQAGFKRHIVNEGVFHSCGYVWGAVATLTSANVDAVPGGAPLTGAPCPLFSPATPVLLQGSGPGVHLTQPGIKRHIPNEVTFSGMGYKWANLDRVSDYYLGVLTTGRPVLDLLNDGFLLQGQGPQIYVMQGGVRRHIQTETVMSACGYSWHAIRYLPDVVLSLIPQGATVAASPCPGLSLPTGTLLQGQGAAVYVVDAGAKRHVSTEAAFAGCGYNWGNIDRVLDAILNWLPTSAPLAPPCP